MADGGNMMDLGGLFVKAGLDWGDLKTGLDDARNLCQQWESQNGRLIVKVEPDFQNFASAMGGLRNLVSQTPINVPLQIDSGTFQLKIEQAANQFTAAFTTAGERVAMAFADDLRAAVSGMQLPGLSPSAAPGGGGAPAPIPGAASGRGIGTGMVNRMFARMLLMQAAEAPIEHAEAQWDDWKNYSIAQQNGSSGEQQKALLKSLDDSTSGLWGNLVMRPLYAAEGYDPVGLAKTIRSASSAESTGELRLKMQDSTASLMLQGQGYFASASGEMQEARAFELKDEHYRAVFAAKEASKKASEEFNATGKREAAEAAYKSAIKDSSAPALWANMTDAQLRASVAQPGQTQDFIVVANKILAARQARSITLAGIAHGEGDITANEKQAIDTANKRLASQESNDQSQQAVLAVRNAASVRDIQVSGRNALELAQGGGSAAELRQYDEHLKNRVKDLRDLAAATQDAAERQRLLNEATAQEAANPQLREAKRIELDLKQREIDLAIQAKSEGLDVRDLELSGNSSAAIRAAGQAQAAQATRSAVQRFMHGDLTLKEFGGEMLGAMRVRGQADVAAQLQSATTTGQIQSLQLQTAAAGQEMSADTRGAVMTRLGAEMIPLQKRLDVLTANGGGNSEEAQSIRARMGLIGAQMGLSSYRFAQSDKMSNMRLDASIKSSQFAQHDELMSAHVAQEVEASKERIAQARASGEPPEIVNKTIRAEQERLRALRHGMFAGRSGALAGADEHGVAGLFGGLAEGRLQAPDLRDALGQLSNKNIADIARGTAPAQAVAPNIAEIVQKMNQILVALGAAPKQN